MIPELRDVQARGRDSQEVGQFVRLHADAVARACHGEATHEAVSQAGVNVAADGSVGDVTMMSQEGNPDDSALARCVAKEMAAWRLPEAQDAAVLFLSLDWRDVKRRRKKLTPAMLQDVLTRRRATISRRCAAHAGDAGERVSARFKVTPAGRVADLVVESDNPRLNTCLEERITNWQFPTAEESTAVAVPFHFIAKKKL